MEPPEPDEPLDGQPSPAIELELATAALDEAVKKLRLKDPASPRARRLEAITSRLNGPYSEDVNLRAPRQRRSGITAALREAVTQLGLVTGDHKPEPEQWRLVDDAIDALSEQCWGLTPTPRELLAELRAAERSVRVGHQELSERKETLKRLIAGLQDLHSQQQTQVSAVESRFKAIDDLTRRQGEQLADAVAADARRIIDSLGQFEVDARRMVGTIEENVGTQGRKKQAEEYANEAQQQNSRAWWWTVAAGVAAVLGTAVAAWLLLNARQGDVEVAEVVSRIAITALIGGLGGIAAGQARGHRRREEAARWTQLQLQTLDLVIEGLDDAHKNEARMTLIRSIYGSSAFGPSTASAETNAPAAGN